MPCQAGRGRCDKKRPGRHPTRWFFALWRGFDSFLRKQIYPKRRKAALPVPGNAKFTLVYIDRFSKARSAPVRIDRFTLSSRSCLSVISTFPFCHLDLPFPSSRPSPSVISTEGRDLNEPRIPSHDNSKIPRRCAPRNDRKEMWSSRKFPTEQVEESLLN